KADALHIDGNDVSVVALVFDDQDLLACHSPDEFTLNEAIWEPLAPLWADFPGKAILPRRVVRSRRGLALAQFPLEEIRRQTPRLLRQLGIVAVSVCHREAVAGTVEKMPVERLAVGLEARHQFLLHRNTCDVIPGAEKNLRCALEILGRVVGVARPQWARLLVAHRRIIADESARARRRRDEVNADAPAHAVANDGAAFGVDLRPRGQI